MRTMMVLIAMTCGCVAGGERTAEQAVAGPGGVTVTVRAEGQLAVSWSSDAAATQYRVMRSAGGGALSFLDSVGGGGGTPSTSYIDTALSGGVLYCYAIQSVYGNGSTSDPGAPGCAAATGSTVAPRTRVIAPNPSMVTPYATIDVVSGAGHSTTNLDGYFEAGDHLRAIRLYIQDNTLPGPAVGYSGPTELVSRLRLFSPSTGSVPTVLATSNISNGSGTIQVLTLSGFDAAISVGGQTHSLQTIDNVGVAPTLVWSIEVDYIPATH